MSWPNRMRRWYFKSRKTLARLNLAHVFGISPGFSLRWPHMRLHFYRQSFALLLNLTQPWVWNQERTNRQIVKSSL